MPPRTRPTTPVDCDCPKARHTHGSNKMYLIHRCGCPPCTEAHRVENGKGSRNARVPVEHAQELLAGFIQAGFPLHTVAAVSGIGRRNLEDIRGRDGGTVTTLTLESLQGARARLTSPTSRRMDATGTARRIQALNTLGWTSTQIAETAGLTRNTVDFIRSGKHARCSAETRAKVITAYDELWDKHPEPSTVSGRRDYTWNVNRATRNGWLPPAAWDDDRIDDPAYTPNVTPLRTTRADRVNDYRELVRLGVHPEEAARRTGYTDAKSADAVTRRAAA